MGVELSPMIMGRMGRRWRIARAGKPRVRVQLHCYWEDRRSWLSGQLFRDHPDFCFVGPSAVMASRHFWEPGESLQQAWRAFCDHHLSALGYSDAGYRASRRLSPDDLTLAPDAPPVSGKHDQPFPLTSPAQAARSAIAEQEDVEARAVFPVSAGFP